MDMNATQGGPGWGEFAPRSRHLHPPGCKYTLLPPIHKGKQVNSLFIRTILLCCLALTSYLSPGVWVVMLNFIISVVHKLD